MCPTGVGAVHREKGFMSNDTFIRIMNDLKGHQLGLRFIRWGEPTLHPDFVNLIKVAKENGHLCHLNTNGTFLTDSLIKQILASGLDSIKFSFQGIDKKSYEEMRQGADFDKFIENIKQMFALRMENGIYMHIATTVTYETNVQVDAFKNAMSAMCDLVTVGRTKLDHIDIQPTRLTEEQKKVFSQLKKKQSLVKKRLLHCPEVFGKLSVDWDGQVSACCQDYDRKMIVGNIHNNTLLEIFNNEKILKYRELLLERKFHKISLCNECYDYMSIQNRGN